MSKCKAVLDGDKITEIRVKTKVAGAQRTNSQGYAVRNAKKTDSAKKKVE